MPTTLRPRLWRSPRSNFWFSDELLEAVNNYDEAELKRIRDMGFDSIWLRGRLYGLMNSPILPELNEPEAQRRIDSLGRVIDRAARLDMQVHLFFNEPVAPLVDHPVWQKHADLAGADWGDLSIDGGKHRRALCTSHPLVREFFAQATRDVLGKLPGLGGMVHITASETHTHCWSHCAKYGLDDGFHPGGQERPDCPRCAQRRPAEVVGELLRIWKEAADATSRCRIVAWNWSWSMWYRDPQQEVIDALPPGVELQADFERGGRRKFPQREIRLDEYSLGYAGPSEQFLATRKAARSRGIPMNAKMQLGTTHELAVVPNLPLVPNLYRKFRGLEEQEVKGIMGCWNFGVTESINTFSVGFYFDSGRKFASEEEFCRALAGEYFGAGVDAAAAHRAWRQFCAAFESYPLAIAFVYFAPINRAPVYPLSLEYRDVRMADAWLMRDELGDRLDDSLAMFGLDEVIGLLKTMHEQWAAGMPDYESALGGMNGAGEVQARRRQRELDTARMIACHLRSTWNIYRFHAWRKGRLEALGLKAPAKVEPDETATAIARDEIESCRAALPLIERNPDFGYHQEARGWFYDRARIEAKIRDLEGMLRAG